MSNQQLPSSAPRLSLTEREEIRKFIAQGKEDWWSVKPARQYWLGVEKCAALLDSLESAERQVERLKIALQNAQEDICSEYCPWNGHHPKCVAAKQALLPPSSPTV